MKLISMTAFVLEQKQKEPEVRKFADFTQLNNHRERSYNSIVSFAKFLKQPLELWMFVPCDKEGNAIEEPEQRKVPNMHPNEQNDYWNEWNTEYQQAKERVLFENCSMFDEYFIHYGEGNLFHINHLKTTVIEFFCDKNLTLTPNAIKQL